MDISQQKKIFAILLFLLIGALTYRFFNPVRQERVASLTYTGSANALAGASAEPARNQELRAMVELIETPPVHPDAVVSRNFFQTIPEASPPPAETLPPLDLESETLAASEPAPAPEPESPETRVHRELSRLKVIGLYASGQDRAVFFQRNKQTLVVRKGDRIDGKYRIIDISAENIILEAEHVTEKIHIDLTPFLKPHEREWLQ